QNSWFVGDRLQAGGYNVYQFALAACRRCRRWTWRDDRNGFRRRLLTVLRTRTRRHGRGHINQFRDGDKFEPLRLELIEGGRHRLNCPRVNVVGQHNGTRSRLLENPTADYRRARPFPVERVNVPENDVVSEFVVDPSFLAVGDRSIWRPKQSRTISGGVLNCIVGSLQLAANTFQRHLGEVWMRPTVVANLVPFPGGSRDNLGMFRNIFTKH